MLRKVSRIGAVLEHVCQLLTAKVVDLGVILEVCWRSIWRPLGGLCGGLLEVDLGLSWRPLGGRFGAHRGLSGSVWHRFGILVLAVSESQ